MWRITPLGILDGLALIKMVSEVRQDVRIVANDILMQVRPLQKLLLPVINIGHGTNRTNVDAIDAALENEEAVIVFPSAEVSRVGPTGIKDGRWHGGFLRFAERAKASDAYSSTAVYSLKLRHLPFFIATIRSNDWYKRTRQM